MYRILFGEINKEREVEWGEFNSGTKNVLDPVMLEKDCDIGTLPMAARIFHDEVQIDWGIFAWKAFKNDIRCFFRRKGISEKELEPFDPYKEYGVVYIDN